MAYGSGIWNVQWLNENSQRNYPLSEEATLWDVTESFKIPLKFIVDMVMPVQATTDINADKFHILNISVFGDGVTVTLGYDGTAIGSASIAASTHEINQAYFIPGVGDFYDSIGKITVGDISSLISTGGSYDFDIAGGRLEPTVIRPNLKGVNSIVVINGQEESENLLGDIELASGRNMQFTVSQPAGGNPRIRMDVIGSSNFNEECVCDDTHAGGSPIKTINGISPDSAGNFTLTSADECLLIEAADTGLLLTDQCSKSCCGCEELDTVVTDLNLLDGEINSLSGIISRLDAQVATALTNLLASKTNDKPSI